MMISFLVSAFTVPLKLTAGPLYGAAVAVATERRREYCPGRTAAVIATRSAVQTSMFLMFLFYCTGTILSGNARSL